MIIAYVLAFNPQNQGAPYAQHYFRGHTDSASPDLYEAEEFSSRKEVTRALKGYALNHHWKPEIRMVEIDEPTGEMTLVPRGQEEDRRKNPSV